MDNMAISRKIKSLQKTLLNITNNELEKAILNYKFMTPIPYFTINGHEKKIGVDGCLVVPINPVNYSILLSDDEACEKDLKIFRERLSSVLKHFFTVKPSIGNRRYVLNEAGVNVVFEQKNIHTGTPKDTFYIRITLCDGNKEEYKQWMDKAYE